jgi:hypothetical protein
MIVRINLYKQSGNLLSSQVKELTQQIIVEDVSGNYIIAEVKLDGTYFDK